MGQINENQEVVARIYMAIKAQDKLRMPNDEIRDEEILEQEEEDCAWRESHSWYLAALDHQTTGKWLEHNFTERGISSSFHKNFNANLKEFLITNTTCNSISVESTIKVSWCSGLSKSYNLLLAFMIGTSVQMHLSTISISFRFHTSSRYSGGQNCFNVARTWIVLLITHEGKMMESWKY